jgi:restriction endonuclease S subunit
MNYKEIEKKFNENKNKLGNEVDINFKDVYPIVTNNGACLFTQHCIYMLEDNGTCAIVLPDGELFIGKKFKKFREYMCEKVNIIKIINVSGKAFEHTTIKTAVIIFQKNGSTKHIEFMDIPDDCNSVKKLMIIHINNIKNNNYNLSYNAYVNKEERQYNDGVVVKTLGDIFNITKGTLQSTKNIEGIYTFITASETNKTHNSFTHDCKCVMFVGGSEGSLAKAQYFEGKFIASDLLHILIAKNPNEINYKYVWYYLNFNRKKHLLDNTICCGTPKKQISQDRCKNIKIPIPSLERQQEIVEECEHITKSIDTIKLRKEQLKSDGILFKKYYKHNELNEIYKNSEVKMLGKIFNCKMGNFNSKDMDNKGSIPFYSSKAYNPVGYHSEYTFDIPEYLLLICSGGSQKNPIGDNVGLGKCYYVEGKTACRASVCSLSIKDTTISINLKYIYYYLNINRELTNIKAKFTTNLGTISKEDIEGIKIPIPSLENQEIIIAYYEQMTNEYKKHILNKIEEHNKELEMFKELCINMFYL